MWDLPTRNLQGILLFGGSLAHFPTVPQIYLSGRFTKAQVSSDRVGFLGNDGQNFYSLGVMKGGEPQKDS
jgi:hypothetical protein